MKKFLTIAILFLLSFTVQCQDTSPEFKFGLNYGVGSIDGFSAYPFNTRETSYQNSSLQFPMFYSYANTSWKTMKVGTFNGEFQFKINDFYTTGFALSYTYIKEKYANQTFVTNYVTNMSLCSIYLMNKITWLHKESFNLYSSMYVGYGFNRIETYMTVKPEVGDEYNIFDTSNPMYFNFQFSPIGIVTKGGFMAEIGFGGQGLLKIGFLI